jgi:beta-aspartyl-peptidase (threonine type)
LALGHNLTLVRIAPIENGWRYAYFVGVTEAVLKRSLIVHGGGWNIPSDLADAHKSACKVALMEGWGVLHAGGHALDAVETAIRQMEDNPSLNAGTGAALNAEGQIELDAGIMEGNGLRAGAVAAVQDIRNPISLARRVLESEHVLLVGRGASLFAKEVGIAECGREELLVEREWRLWEALKEDATFRSQKAYGAREADTVGAVAIDERGDIVAGNSTGGSPHKHPGRVGDSPLVGCGIYADNSVGGVACTGWGESIIRLAMAKTAVGLLREGRPVQEAATLAVQMLAEKVRGLGGLIMIDREGEIGYAFSTPAMAYAYLSDGLRQPVIGI